jgi:hypothetical protein
MWQERWECWTDAGRRERCGQVCQKIWAPVDTTFNIDVDCSFDAGTTFTQLGDAIDTAHAFLNYLPDL